MKIALITDIHNANGKAVLQRLEKIGWTIVHSPVRDQSASSISYLKEQFDLINLKL